MFWPASELPRRRSVSARRALGRPGRDHLRLGPLAGRPLRIVLIPAALLVILGLIIYAGVTSGARCVAARPARTAAAVGYTPAGRVCPSTQAAASAGTSDR